MKTPTPRALRLSLVTLLTFAALALGTGKAQAQWAEPICMNPADIPGLFTATDWSAQPKCESLCKYSATYCKTFVRDAASCNQTDARGYWTLFGKVQCDTQALPADRKSCNDLVRSAKVDSKGTFDDSRNVALAQCDVMLNTCLAGCGAPVVLNH